MKILMLGKHVYLCTLQVIKKKRVYGISTAKGRTFFSPVLHSLPLARGV